MTNKIQILSDFLANQIAAGEVVQRPESVVKELIENALDSGADTIAIFINDAGKSLIHIVDNGNGMSKTDLLLAPVRHATSKIRSADDLTEIKTFGFRGEAIPSIASVSLLEIRSAENTSTANSLDSPNSEPTAMKPGWKLTAEPLKEFQIEKISMPYGTQIFVRNLFYNVPARRKFLKSNATEQKYIHETVIKFALAHPKIRFIFYDNDKLIFDVKPQTLQKRIETLLTTGTRTITATTPPEDNPQLLEVDYSVNDIHIHGYVGHPQTARKTNYIQYFFLNSRSINSKNLAYSVFVAFEHLINNKAFKPFFILNIDVDYKSVDVNVHPQKSEVKFEDEKLIFSAVKRAVQKALELHNFLPDISPSASPSPDINPNDAINPLQVPTTFNKTITSNTHSIAYSNDYSASGSNVKTSQNLIHKVATWQTNTLQTNDPNANLQHSIDLLYRNSTAQPVASDANSTTMLASENTQLNLDEINTGNLWQLHNKYILMQTQTGLLAIDQHNAHERIIYEKLVATATSTVPTKQSLLFPVECNVSSLQLITIRGLQVELNNMGFNFEIEDSQTVRKVNILSQPCDISLGTTALSFLEIIDDYISNEELKLLSKQDRISATVACKAAIKAGQKLSDDEMQNLILNFLQCKMHYVCPHGRPIVVFFPLNDWDKKFGRI